MELPFRPLPLEEEVLEQVQPPPPPPGGSRYVFNLGYIKGFFFLCLFASFQGRRVGTIGRSPMIAWDLRCMYVVLWEGLYMCSKWQVAILLLEASW